jgi:signal transduction histidine kinase
MDWMTIAWPMVTAACVTMGAIHLRTGLRRKTGTAYLFFSLNALVVAVYSCLELALTDADSPARYLAVLRWMDLVGGGAMVATLTAFVWVFFGTGRRWLVWLAPCLMGVSLIPDLLPVPKLVFLQITGIRTMQTFGGQTYMAADGVRNPWNVVFYLAVLLLVVFVADASFTLWRRGARRRAAVVGGSIVFFILAAGVHSALVDAGLVPTPYLFSFGYLAILVAMGEELSDDVLRAAQLAHALQENERRLALAAETAQDLAGRLISAHEEERARLARELHDGLGQNLLLIKNRLALASARRADTAELTTQLEAAAAATNRAVDEVRTISHSLRPAALEQVGLTKALEWMIEQHGEGASTRFSAELDNIDGLLAPEREIDLFRIVQEGLNNINRHAGATQVILEARSEGRLLRVSLFDDGRGFDREKLRDNTKTRLGLGLASMDERARCLGGNLEIQSKPGRGTRLTVRIPLSPRKG